MFVLSSMGIISSILLLVALMWCVSMFLGVPFLPTHKAQAKHMMLLAEIKPGTVAVDLGSGAGRLLFLAAERGATAIGYELNPFLYCWTKVVIFFKRTKGVSVQLRSLYDADLGNVDVVFAFLFPGPMVRLTTKLFSELKPGAKIVSYAFDIPGKTPIKKEQGIFVYQV